jgi:hypothetical protein
MPEVSSCPDVPTLRRLTIGQISDQEAEALEEHVAQCETCMATLSRLETSDSLVERLRGGQAIAAALPQGQVVEDLMCRLLRLPAPQAGHACAGSGETAPVLGGTPAPDTRPETFELLGTVIGPYKLMELIGEGGMGLVFVAEQHEPVRRKVALKLTKPGMDTRQVIARFEAERQALALMEHPNIAMSLDPGMTGVPCGVSDRVPDD